MLASVRIFFFQKTAARNISVTRDAVTRHLVLEMSRHLDASRLPPSDREILTKDQDLGARTMKSKGKRFVFRFIVS